MNVAIDVLRTGKRIAMSDQSWGVSWDTIDCPGSARVGSNKKDNLETRRFRASVSRRLARQATRSARVLMSTCTLGLGPTDIKYFQDHGYVSYVTDSDGLKARLSVDGTVDVMNPGKRGSDISGRQSESEQGLVATAPDEPGLWKVRVIIEKNGDWAFSDTQSMAFESANGEPSNGEADSDETDAADGDECAAADRPPYCEPESSSNESIEPETYS